MTTDAERWQRIQNRLDQEQGKLKSSYGAAAETEGWRGVIKHFGQTEAMSRRASGQTFSDSEVLEAAVLSVLSSQTDWINVEAVRSQLPHIFNGYDLRWYAELTDEEVDQNVSSRLPKLGQGRLLGFLRGTASRLWEWSERHGSAADYFETVRAESDGDEIKAVVKLGSSARWKLPAMGVPLAAETARNLGFDVAKPDRHICRAAGTWGWVGYRSWPAGRARYAAPAPGTPEYRETMRKMSAFAASVGQSAVFVDTAIWLLCAKSGAHLTNDELRQL